MAGFWDKLKSRRNKRKDDDDRDERDEERNIAIFLEEQRLANIEAQRKQQEEARKKEEARKGEREKQALAEQRKLEEANRKASQERTVINPYEPRDVVRNVTRENPVSQESNSQKKALDRNISLEGKDEEKEQLLEYVNPQTGKVLLIRPGQLAPRGFVQRNKVDSAYGGTSNRFINSNEAVQRARANADRLIYGKQALTPSKKSNNFFTPEFAQSAKKQGINIELSSNAQFLSLPSIPEINTAQTVESALSEPVTTNKTAELLSTSVDSTSVGSTSVGSTSVGSTSVDSTSVDSKSAVSTSIEPTTKTTITDPLSNDVNTQKVIDESLQTTSSEPKTALAPSKTGSLWQQAAGTGQLADSAARVELSTNIDTTNMTEEDKAIYAKEQTWKNMSEEQKILARQTLPDKDGDMVPDIYDCVPDDYTKQGYADIYLGGKYAMQPSKKAQRTIVSGKGRLKMAQSMQGPKAQKGSVAPEAMVGQILDLTAGGSAAGNNPALAGGGNVVSNALGGNKGKNFANKLNANSPLTKSVTVKSKTNDAFKVNMNRNFNKKYSVEALNRKKFDSKMTSKQGLDKMSANKAFKDVSKRFGL